MTRRLPTRIGAVAVATAVALALPTATIVATVDDLHRRRDDRDEHGGRHEVCSGAQWVNNADILAQYNSFHPNAAGYSGGYQPVVKASLGLGSGGGKGGKGKVTTGTVTSTDTQRGKVNVG